MIAIIGAGITGLYLGHLLQQKGLNFQIFEANGQTGGNMGTIHDGPYQMDT